MSRAVIFAGGSLSDYSFYKKNPDDFIICADSGYNHAKALGLIPNALLGDFDSLKGEKPTDVEIIKFASEKDETDTHLAVLYALKQGFKDIYIVGAIGDRMDHTLANIGLLKLILDSGAEGIIEDSKNRLSITYCEKIVYKKEGFYLSLIPIFGDVIGVTLEGFKYPLNNATLKMGSTIGISNEILGDSAKILLKEGCLLISESKD